MNFYHTYQRRGGRRERRRSYLFIFPRQKCLPRTVPQVKHTNLYSEQMSVVDPGKLLEKNQPNLVSKKRFVILNYRIYNL